MATITKDTNPVAAVVFACMGGKFRLHEIKSRKYGSSYSVLDDQGNVIGEAYQRYANGGFSVWTKPYAGYVSPDNIEWV